MRSRSESVKATAPSVAGPNEIVKLLKKDGLLQMDEMGYLKLTEAGEEKAKRIYERHTVLSGLFMKLGVDEKTATEDACRIEHYISDTTFDAIKAHMKNHQKG